MSEDYQAQLDRLLNECALGHGRLVCSSELTHFHTTFAYASDRVAVRVDGVAFVLLPWDIMTPRERAHLEAELEKLHQVPARREAAFVGFTPEDANMIDDVLRQAGITVGQGRVTAAWFVGADRTEQIPLDEWLKRRREAAVMLSAVDPQVKAGLAQLNQKLNERLDRIVQLEKELSAEADESERLRFELKAIGDLILKWYPGAFTGGPGITAAVETVCSQSDYKSRYIDELKAIIDKHVPRAPNLSNAAIQKAVDMTQGVYQAEERAASAQQEAAPQAAESPAPAVGRCTGIYLHLKRDGRWGPVDIAEATREEIAWWLNAHTYDDVSTGMAAEVVADLADLAVTPDAGFPSRLLYEITEEGI